MNLLASVLFGTLWEPGLAVVFFAALSALGSSSAHLPLRSMKKYVCAIGKWDCTIVSFLSVRNT